MHTSNLTVLQSVPLLQKASFENCVFPQSSENVVQGDRKTQQGSAAGGGWAAELRFSLKKILGKLLIKYCMQTTLTASCIIQTLVGVLETTGFKRKLGKRRKLEGLLGKIVLFFTQAKHHLACLYSRIW